MLKASEIFGNIKSIYTKDFESSKNIDIDFSDIENVDLKAIKTLLDIQKVALLNHKTLALKNVNSEVKNMLDITGVNKTFSNLATNPVTARQR